MGFLANKSYPCGKVVQGDYKDAYVYIWDENTLSLFREKELVFGKFVSEETHRKSLNHALIANISSHTVENYEVLSQNQSSEDAGDVLNATLLFGAVGTIAASRQITKTNYLISVEFQSGKKSIIRLNEAGYENFLTAIKFKIKPQENKINEKTSQAQPSFSVADELKKFKELLDCGAISQEEFDSEKKKLLGGMQEPKRSVGITNNNYDNSTTQPTSQTNTVDFAEYSFFMKVDDVVSIRDKGIAAIGTIEKGEVFKGDEVFIMRKDGDTIKAKVIGIAQNAKQLYIAHKEYGTISLLLNVKSGDILQGNIIIKE